MVHSLIIIRGVPKFSRDSFTLHYSAEMPLGGNNDVEIWGVRFVNLRRRSSVYMYVSAECRRDFYSKGRRTYVRIVASKKKFSEIVALVYRYTCVGNFRSYLEYVSERVSRIAFYW